LVTRETGKETCTKPQPGGAETENHTGKNSFREPGPGGGGKGVQRKECNGLRHTVEGEKIRKLQRKSLVPQMGVGDEGETEEGNLGVGSVLEGLRRKNVEAYK